MLEHIQIHSLFYRPLYSSTRITNKNLKLSFFYQESVWPKMVSHNLEVYLCRGVRKRVSPSFFSTILIDNTELMTVSKCLPKFTNFKWESTTSLLIGTGSRYRISLPLLLNHQLKSSLSISLVTATIIINENKWKSHYTSGVDIYDETSNVLWRGKN